MDNRKQTIIYQVLNIIGFIAVLTLNALANILPINGKNTGELSDAILNLFVPTGLTFSIWSVIYSLLFVFTVYQGLNIGKRKPENVAFLHKIGYWWFINAIANSAWILAWHYELVELSLAIMAVIFFTLLVIYLKLGIALPSKDVTRQERGLVHPAFSVYIGWITVATIANVTAVFVVNRPVGSTELLGISDTIWTVLVIVVGAIIGGLTTFTRKDILYGAVVIWAYLGIIIKRLDPIWAPQPAIVLAALVSIIAIAAIQIYVALMLLKHKDEQKEEIVLSSKHA